VVHDCLQICANVLRGSETCQRLFFGMGTEWILKLGEFFEPTLVESFSQAAGAGGGLDGSDGASGSCAWFDVPNRAGCAALALDALAGALGAANPKHQATIATSTFIVSAAAFWAARRGPHHVVAAALAVLEGVVHGNADVAAAVANVVIKVPPAVSGKTIPAGEDVPPLMFGWRPLPTNERRLVAVPALLAERYVYSSQAWTAEGLGGDVPGPPRDGGIDVRAPDGLSQRCLLTLETLLAADATTCDLMIQFVLAPPPPSPEMDLDDMQLESARPLGTILVNLLAECCAKAVGAAGAAHVHAARGDYAVGERAANVLSLLFTCGGMLARELSTAISTGHTSLGGAGGYDAVPTQPLLPFLLSAAGRAARTSPHGGGHALLVAVLRLLSTVAAGCEPAAKLMLDDPSNFFVLDLATAASEGAGVPASVQVAACLFLGTCFQALKDGPDGRADDGGGALTRRSLLGMIDGRVGLNRLNEVLRRPLPQHRPAAGLAAQTALAQVAATRSDASPHVTWRRAGPSLTRPHPPHRCPVRACRISFSAAASARFTRRKWMPSR